MVIKMGRYGKFMACSNFPDCRNTKAIVKTIGVTCPTCKKAMLLKENLRKIAYFMVVLIIQNVILFHGINQLEETVQNVSII